MHGHYLIFQGLSFSDGMLIIEGAFPGYQPDTTVWRDSLMREEFEIIMADREAAGHARYKVYADEIYSSSALVTAAYSRRLHRDGLQDWQIKTNRLMSDIRVGVAWSFGKLISKKKVCIVWSIDEITRVTCIKILSCSSTSYQRTYFNQ